MLDIMTNNVWPTFLRKNNPYFQIIRGFLTDFNPTDTGCPSIGQTSMRFSTGARQTCPKNPQHCLASIQVAQMEKCVEYGSNDPRGEWNYLFLAKGCRASLAHLS